MMHDKLRKCRSSCAVYMKDLEKVVCDLWNKYQAEKKFLQKQSEDRLKGILGIS